MQSGGRRVAQPGVAADPRKRASRALLGPLNCATRASPSVKRAGAFMNRASDSHRCKAQRVRREATTLQRVRPSEIGITLIVEQSADGKATSGHVAASDSSRTLMQDARGGLIRWSRSPWCEHAAQSSTGIPRAGPTFAHQRKADHAVEDDCDAGESEGYGTVGSCERRTTWAS